MKRLSRTIAGGGEAERVQVFLIPEDVAISPDGSWAVIADTGNHVLLLIEGLRSRSVQSSLLAGTVGQGGYAGGDPLSSTFGTISGVAIDPQWGSYIIIVDRTNALLRKLEMDSAHRTVYTLLGPDWLLQQTIPVQSFWKHLERGVLWHRISGSRGSRLIPQVCLPL